MITFKCPECGSTKTRSQLNVSTDLSTGGGYSSPWSHVLLQYECAGCYEYIPGHLGERWNDISYEKAKKDWREIYKPARLKDMELMKEIHSKENIE